MRYAISAPILEPVNMGRVGEGLQDTIALAKGLNQSEVLMKVSRTSSSVLLLTSLLIPDGKK